jgi:MOSC domain-containing protein YiiM
MATARPTSPSTAAPRRRSTPTRSSTTPSGASSSRRSRLSGAFGENLTVEGLPLEEEEVAVGDHFRVGTAELVVTQPRLPCYKLGLRFGREDIVKRFLASRRTGYYLAVEVEGDVGAGDHVEMIARDPARIPVAEITRVYASDRDDRVTIERVVALDALPDDWRSYFEKQLARKRPAAAIEQQCRRKEEVQ